MHKRRREGVDVTCLDFVVVNRNALDPPTRERGSCHDLIVNDIHERINNMNKQNLNQTNEISTTATVMRHGNQKAILNRTDTVSEKHRDNHL